MKPELGILLWAAGANRDVRDIRLPETDILLGLLQAHNLVCRFFQRCQAERPPWYTRVLSIPLWNQARAIEARTQRQIIEVQKIAEVLPPEAGPLIVIKGPATFAATGERQHLRWSGDLDLLCRDNERLWQTLLSLGYHGKKEEFDETKSADHEYAVLTRGEMVVEIHDHFPVASYPEAIAGADLTPAHHAGEWVQPIPMFRQSRLTYEQMAAHSMKGMVAEAKGFDIPDPAAAIAVLCAHEFRNYLHSPFTGMTVRLSALADVYDLARHRCFDADRFLALITETGATDSAKFVASLLLTYFGEQPLPISAEPFEGATFPQTLSYSGGWASLSEPSDILLQSGSEIYALRLSTNHVCADNGLLTCRIINDPSAPAATARAWPDEDALRLQVTLSDPLPLGQEYEIYAHSRRRASSPDAWAWDFLTGDNSANALVHDLTFQWNSLPRRYREDKRVPMMLSVGRFSREERRAAGWFSGKAYEPLAVFPLEICW